MLYQWRRTRLDNDTLAEYVSLQKPEDSSLYQGSTAGKIAWE